MQLESASLTHHEWLEIHEASLDFHRQTTLDALRLSILQWTTRVIPSETISLCDNRGGLSRIPWMELSPDARQINQRSQHQGAAGVMMITEFDRDVMADRESYLTLWDTAPNVPDPAKVPHLRVQQFSQYHTAREFRKTQLYSETYAPVDQEMWIGIQLGASKVTVAAARKRREYTDVEMLKLELLRPQIEIAYHRLLAAGKTPVANRAGSLEKMLQAGLTQRESDVLYWLAEGKTNPEIAIILCMSRSTVKTHLLKIFAKLGCETRTAATRWVLESA